MDRLKTLMKQITPIEESRDMFFHDSGVNGAITGAWLEAKNAPAVDAVPVVHGRWKQVLEELGWVDCPHIVHRNTCSICGYVKRTELNKTVKWRYCPNCGAKMDGGEEDG